ncbi:isochorismate synthase [Saccharicrinis aurantiacus]|uniref:isochorismate synthase n=1 Tax=Saccharicrinis aurantiacus TaxID=1849719 RepID=UPI00083908D4|nr:isochorismate synthase [Saccharicrinis aurantiacus]
MKVVQQKEVLQYCIANQLTFAITRLPQANQAVLVIAKSAEEMHLSDAINSQGFVLAPFNMQNQQVVFINADFECESVMSELEFDAIKKLKPTLQSAPTEAYVATFDSYAKQFNQLMEVINGGHLDKAILSRVKPNTSLTQTKAHEFYYSLESSYKQAYVFMFYTPQSGLWAGASPELLLHTANNIASTVSLAGTRKLDNVQSNWGDKEIVEQQIVSDYVGQLLKQSGVSNYQKDGPHTINAGKMVHLKTSYQFKTSDLQSNLSEFIVGLHPTPAVCGLPKNKAMGAILNIEQHQRGFYAGFMGSVQAKKLNLYVNIRSLRFTQSGVNMYLGGGITKDSDLEMEWNETELKAQTMLNVIEQLPEQ